MSHRRNDLTPVRQFVARPDSAASSRTTRLTSPDLIEQLTPPVSRIYADKSRQSYSLVSNAIKQEDSVASRYFVREPSIDSNSFSAHSQSFPRSQLLRGAQYGLNEDEISNSASIFSSGSSQGTSSYHNEEQIATQLQQQQTNGSRRTSGTRKSRPSADDLPYKPRSSDYDDDDDAMSDLPRRRRSKTSWPNMRTGQDDNSIWMTTKRKAARRSKGSRSSYPVEDIQDISNSYEDETDGQKETRWDTNTEELNGITHTPNAKPTHTTAAVTSTASRIASFLLAFLSHALSGLAHAIRQFAKLFNSLHLRELIMSLLALLTLLTALYLATRARLPSTDSVLKHTYPPGDAPWTSSPVTPRRTDRTEKMLQAEIDRLSARLDALPSHFDTQVAARVKEVEIKLRAENEARKEADVQRLMQTAKRQVSRLAQEELANIQNSVANSVELMLGQLNQKVDEQLKKRADATQDEFFSHLDKEIRKITQYANEEVNSRLKQSFDETYLTDLITQSLETYSQDRTGKFDYASITSGAVLDERGTVHRGYRLNSVWNLKTFLSQGRKVAIGDPVKAITPGASLGQDDCWMTGWDSVLQVNLSSTRVIDQVVLEHPLPGMARTAPRRVIVWGLVDQADQQYYQQYRRLGGRDPELYVKELLPTAYHDAILKEYRQVESMPLILSFFEFKANGSTLQNFNTTEEAQYYPHGIEAVRWQFIDGWAQYPPICVHRVRLHGSHWPIFDSH